MVNGLAAFWLPTYAGIGHGFVAFCVLQSADHIDLLKKWFVKGLKRKFPSIHLS